MTDAVSDHVLYGSYIQTQAMSLAGAQSVSMVEVHARLIRRLEQVASLDREIEDLPSQKTIAARQSERRGLVAPELATLHGLRQDLPVLGAAGVRPARGPLPDPRSGAVLPGATAESGSPSGSAPTGCAGS